MLYQIIKTTHSSKSMFSQDKEFWQPKTNGSIITENKIVLEILKALCSMQILEKVSSEKEFSELKAFSKKPWRV